jgi:alkylhydroperoxidase family enzyme
MARIPYINREKAPREVDELFSKMESHGADVLNLWKMAAHSPATLKHMVKLGNTILSRTELEPKLREMAIIRVAEILDCEYERKAHIMFGKELGMTNEQVTGIKDWESSSVFTATESAVLRFTDEVTGNGKASQSTFSEVEKYLDHREMMELTITAGFYGMLGRLLLTFDVDLEDNALASASQIVGR